MDVLDYMEREGEKTFAESMRAYTATHERIYSLAAAVLAGAVVIAAWALDQYIKQGVPVYIWACTGVVSLYWFGVVALLVCFGLRSYPLSNGATVSKLIAHYDKQAGAWDEVCYPGEIVAREGRYPGGPLVELRRHQLQNVDFSTSAYMRAQAARTWWLTWAYRMLAATPLPPMVVIVWMRFC